jgi:hypothetical protein
VALSGRIGDVNGPSGYSNTEEGCTFYCNQRFHLISIFKDYQLTSCLFECLVGRRVSFRRKKNKDEVSPGPKKEEANGKGSKKVVEEKVRN